MPSLGPRLLSFRALLGFGLVLVYLLTIRNRFNDPDLWFHLKIGEVIWNTHRVPSTELFSHTAFGHAWTAHEWLAQVSIYAAYRLGEYRGLFAWSAVLGSILLLLLYELGYRQARNELVAFLATLLAFFFGTVGFAIRPQLLGYTMLALELLILDAARRNPRLLWTLPPLFAVWANCHGSYAFGLGVLGVQWLSSFVNGKWGFVTSLRASAAERRLRGWIVVLCGAALFATPVGWRLVLYPADVLLHQATGLGAVEEWLPPKLNDERALLMIAAALAIPVLCALRRAELMLSDLVVMAAALWLASQHARMLFVYGVAVAPVLCRVLGTELKREHQREQVAANALLIACGIAILAVSWPSRQFLEEQIAKSSPVAAVDYIRKNGIRGPLLNEYVFGGYLIWALPEVKVFVDGRSDVYDWTGVLADYGRWATLSQDPQILLEKYGIRLCVLSAGSPMVAVMPYLPDWHKVYDDKIAVIFTR